MERVTGRSGTIGAFIHKHKHEPPCLKVTYSTCHIKNSLRRN